MESMMVSWTVDLSVELKVVEKVLKLVDLTASEWGIDLVGS